MHRHALLVIRKSERNDREMTHTTVSVRFLGGKWIADLAPATMTTLNNTVTPS
jgi:hypothetical protein